MLISQINHTKQLILVEIADNDKLLTVYGERIPVLQRTDSLAELDWPFTMDSLIKFMQP